MQSKLLTNVLSSTLVPSLVIAEHIELIKHKEHNFVCSPASVEKFERKGQTKGQVGSKPPVWHATILDNCDQVAWKMTTSTRRIVNETSS